MSVQPRQLPSTEIVENGQVGAVRDSGGVPAPHNGDGLRSMPFWSLRSRAEKVIANVPAYRGLEPFVIPLEVWRTRWVDGLERDGILVGLNWSGTKANGFDFQPAEVRTCLDTARRLSSPGAAQDSPRHGRC